MVRIVFGDLMLRLFLAVSILITVPLTASAAIVSGSGGDGTTGFSVGPTYGREAFASSFTLGADYENVSINANVFCISCTGSFSLQRTALGSTASLGDMVDGFSVDSSVTPFGSGNYTISTQLFSGLSLVAGDYFLIFETLSGTGGWFAATPPVVEAETGNSVNFQFEAASTQGFVAGSDFNAILDLRSLAQYSVSGSLSTVPLPGGFLLFASGLAGLGLLARRKKLLSRFIAGQT